MIKNPKAIIIGVALFILGIGLMGLSAMGSYMKSIGGGIFLIGCGLLIIFLYKEFNKDKL